MLSEVCPECLVVFIVPDICLLQTNVCFIGKNLSLCLIKHHIMMICGGGGILLHEFLTLALDGGEWLASHCGLDTVKKKESLASGRNQIPLLWSSSP
jgi:hypothetical protein